MYDYFALYFFFFFFQKKKRKKEITQREFKKHILPPLLNFSKTFGKNNQ